MNQVPAKPKRARILHSGIQVKRWTARVEVDAYSYLAEVCRKRGFAMSKALTAILREHRSAACVLEEKR